MSVSLHKELWCPHSCAVEWSSALIKFGLSSIRIQLFWAHSLSLGERKEQNGEEKTERERRRERKLVEEEGRKRIPHTAPPLPASHKAHHTSWVPTGCVSRTRPCSPVQLLWLGSSLALLESLSQPDSLRPTSKNLGHPPRCPRNIF